jgi:hypothetical protein
MNKLLITLAYAAGVVLAGSAYAGRDAGQMYEQERANQRAAAQQDLASRKTTLPLDHGPRAETTPWLNKQRLLLAEAIVKPKREETPLVDYKPK